MINSAKINPDNVASSINSFNDWDPLEEVIVGSIENSFVPSIDDSFWSFQGAEYDLTKHVPGNVPRQLIDETEEDIGGFVSLLEKFGVTVRRPAPIDFSRVVATPDWSTEGLHALMPRDSVLIVGQTVIEVPMACRARHFEGIAWRDILLSHLGSGMRWYSAPRPRLLKGSYIVPSAPGGPRLNNLEPVFDAANILRIGEDIFFSVNVSGNEMGARWLQDMLGSDYRVHLISVCPDHVDTTLVPIGPGRLLVNPKRINPDNLPKQFRSWEIIYGPAEPPKLPYGLGDAWSSDWIGLNIFNIDENNIVVESGQTELIRILEKQPNLNVIPLPYRHSKTFGGGWHCITLDLRRRGALQNYCS